MVTKIHNIQTDSYRSKLTKSSQKEKFRIFLLRQKKVSGKTVVIYYNSNFWSGLFGKSNNSNDLQELNIKVMALERTLEKYIVVSETVVIFETFTFSQIYTLMYA